MIPKIVHYCWLSDDPIPHKLKKCMNSWADKLPDYEFILWDLKRFDINSILWVKQAFELKKYAFAADYIRLFAVYHYGGIYLDMDVEIVKSFDEKLLSKPYMLAYETVSCDAIEAGVFGAENKAAWLADCLQYYEGRSFILSNNAFDRKPLPQIMYSIMKEKYLDTKLLELYSKDYFTAKSYLTGKIEQTEVTYTIHHFAGSWKPKNYKFKKKIAQIIGENMTRILINIKSLFYRVKKNQD